MIHKVLAYITRRRGAGEELLVFTHRDCPEAGVQVPAGTVEAGEPIEAALHREIWEEAGVRGLSLRRKLAEQEDRGAGIVQHVFHLAAPPDLPEAWSHAVEGNGEDQGLAFDYCWARLADPIELAGRQNDWLPLLLDGRRVESH